MPLAPLRVLLVAEDALARAGVAWALSALDDVEVAGQAAPGEAAGEALASAADVALWDLGPAPLEGDESPALDLPVPVLALAVDGAEARAALAAGARGAVSRAGDAERLRAGLHAVAAGLRVVDDALADAWEGPARRAAPALVEPLTPREEEVLGLVADGLSNRRIARRLGISEHTAKFHVNALLRKLDAASRTDAVVRAARLGLLDL